MIYRITGGIAFVLLGATALGIAAVPAVVTAVFCLIAGVALLAGV